MNGRIGAAIGCLALAALGTAFSAFGADSSAFGVYLRGAPEANPAPQVMANPAVSGLVAESSWARMAPAADRNDFSYFDRALGLAAIARKRVVLTAGGRVPEWAQPDESAAWERFVMNLGSRFAGAEAGTVIAIGAPGLAGAVWPLAGESAIRFDAESLRRNAALFAAAFPGKPLILYLDFSADPNPEVEKRLGELAETARAAAAALVILSPANLQGDLEWLEARRHLGEIVRPLRLDIGIGARLTLHSPAAESTKAETAGAENGNPGEPVEIRFRRALEYSLWMGATHYEVAEGDCETLAFRADLAWLRGVLGGLQSPPPSASSGAPPTPGP